MCVCNCGTGDAVLLRFVLAPCGGESENEVAKKGEDHVNNSFDRYVVFVCLLLVQKV